MIQVSIKTAALAATLGLGGCAGFDFMGGGPRPVQAVDFEAKKAEKRCDSNGVCRIKVFVRIAPNGKCEVMPQFDDIKIGPGFKPKMHWKLDSIDVGHVYDYRFALSPSSTPPVHGIAIPTNDPTLDFYDPDHDTNPSGQKDITTFKWDNKHDRVRTVAYDLNVERSLHNQNVWSACDRVDPKMFNE